MLTIVINLNFCHGRPYNYRKIFGNAFSSPIELQLELLYFISFNNNRLEYSFTFCETLESRGIVQSCQMISILATDGVLTFHRITSFGPHIYTYFNYLINWRFYCEDMSLAFTTTPLVFSFCSASFIVNHKKIALNQILNIFVN